MMIVTITFVFVIFTLFEYCYEDVYTRLHHPLKILTNVLFLEIEIIYLTISVKHKKTGINRLYLQKELSINSYGIQFFDQLYFKDGVLNVIDD